MRNLHIILCNITLLSVVLCNDTTVNKSKIINNTPPVSLLANETQVPSEGGSISPDKLSVAMPLPNVNENLSSIEKEPGRSKIVARKGAGNYTGDVTKSSENSTLYLSGNVSVNTGITVENSSITNEQPKPTTKIISLPIPVSTMTNKMVSTTSKAVETPKKPTILDADLLENAPTEVKSSPETLVHSQIQSPNNKVKSYISNANSHPGMVMPIVITILLVPMFAVLGYMALRRGQEAWKNRHYKRMDFLLDGMYND